MFLTDARRFRIDRFQFLAGVLESDFAFGAFIFLLRDGGLVGFALADGAFLFAAEAFEIETRNRDAGIGARILLGKLAHLMAEGESVFFAVLLKLAELVEIEFELSDVPRELLIRSGFGVKLLILLGEGLGDFAQFALQRERAARLLVSTAESAAVIALAVGQKEVEFRE